jgi:aryl-phospho-beta-D-glucosidase BglC (GH1 family)
MNGFNLDQMATPPLTAADFQVLGRWGVRLVRSALALTRCPECDEYAIAPLELQYLENVIAAGEKHGFSVIITLNPRPTGSRAEFWNTPRLRRSIAGLWEKLALKYGQDPRVVAFDLINEPVAPGSDEQAAERWGEFAQELAFAIRRHASNKTLIVEPTPWGLPKGFRRLKKLDDRNVVYSFHFYEPHAVTHQGLPGHSESVEYPSPPGAHGRSFDKAWLSEVLAPVREFARDNNVAILVGEFSCVRWAPEKSAARYVADAISLFEEAGWAWLYHAFREYDAWDAEMDAAAPRTLAPGERARYRRSDAPVSLVLRQHFTGLGGTHHTESEP